MFLRLLLYICFWTFWAERDALTYSCRIETIMWTYWPSIHITLFQQLLRESFGLLNDSNDKLGKSSLLFTTHPCTLNVFCIGGNLWMLLLASLREACRILNVNWGFFVIFLTLKSCYAGGLFLERVTMVFPVSLFVLYQPRRGLMKPKCCFFFTFWVWLTFTTNLLFA